MASSSANHLDTPITLKVNFDGVTRRYKLPLRDLNVNVLENKVSILVLRTILVRIYESTGFDHRHHYCDD